MKNDEKVVFQLERIGLLVGEKQLTVIESDKEIDFKEILYVSLVTPQISLFKKVLFWVNRVLSRGGYYFYHQAILFDKNLDYRYLYELKISLKDGQVVSEFIKDFDLFAVTRAIDELNMKITQINS